MASNSNPPTDIITNRSSKYRPAYEGAKFDTSGYCLKHPMIRLCKPSGDDSRSSEPLLNVERQSKYKIIRKVCPMCGEHSLRNDRKLNAVVNYLFVNEM
jgi:hypothetical protein